ncbi:hypothetical protein LUZ60_008004 [Juncus effusus]|nr:hypothetical protein LUZ60_008004 [Juncus effusus]
MAPYPYILPKRAMNMMSLDNSSYSTSGSEHDSLSFLVNEFLENDYASTVDTSSYNDSGDGSDSDSVSKSNFDRAIQASEEIKKLLDPSLKCNQLFSDLKEAIEGLELIKENRSGFRRAVMTRLREKGYESGLCKVKWEGSKGLAKGNYEYIDVAEIIDGKEERYIIDVHFAAEFEVSGPTEEYQTVLAAVPEAIVTRPDEMKRVLRIMADEAKRSLKRRGLSVPPWRKRRFLMAKWLGSYKRTVNPVSASVELGIIPLASGGTDHVKCRKVGFFLPQPLGSYV